MGHMPPPGPDRVLGGRAPSWSRRRAWWLRLVMRGRTSWWGWRRRVAYRALLALTLMREYDLGIATAQLLTQPPKGAPAGARPQAAKRCVEHEWVDVTAFGSSERDLLCARCGDYGTEPFAWDDGDVTPINVATDDVSPFPSPRMQTILS